MTATPEQIAHYEAMAREAAQQVTSEAEAIVGTSKATPTPVLKSTCRHCQRDIITVVGGDGQIVPWWHPGTALEQCDR
jgi:hypothetical protein